MVLFCVGPHELERMWDGSKCTVVLALGPASRRGSRAPAFLLICTKYSQAGFYSTTNKMHLLSQIIYSCKTLYMFRTVFSSIVRNSKLCIQQRYMSPNSCCYLLLSGMRWNAVPSHPRYQQLFDIYRCCIHSFELLMMDGKTVRNM